MRVLAYVSDEMYLALPGVIADFESASGEVTVLHSSARGAFYGDLPPGTYKVTLAKDGFGSKTVTVDLTYPPQFRLLADGLIGYI